MSTARQLIADARREGASFRLIGDRLRLVPDTGRDLPPSLVERAKALRSEVLAILSPPRIVDNLPTPSDGNDGLSLRKNRDALRAGLTDRWCACGQMATYAWPMAGHREVWCCLKCTETESEAST